MTLTTNRPVPAIRPHVAVPAGVRRYLAGDTAGMSRQRIKNIRLAARSYELTDR